MRVVTMGGRGWRPWRKTDPGYVPEHWGAGEGDWFEVLGADVVRASNAHYGATMQYMFGLGTFRAIRLDLRHRVRLITHDRDLVRNRAAGHREENIYTVAIQLATAEGWFLPVRLVPVLASEFDHWMADHRQRS